MEDIQMQKGSSVNPDGKLYLRLERPLFHSGTLSTKAPALVKIYPEAVASISPAIGESLSLKSGDMVKVSTRTGSLELPVNIDNELDNLSVMLTNNFEDKGAFSLMEYTIDPVTKAPVIDTNEAKLEKSVRPLGVESHRDSEVRA